LSYSRTGLTPSPSPKGRVALRDSKSPIHPNNYGYFLLMDSFFLFIKKVLSSHRLAPIASAAKIPIENEYSKDIGS
ncbi:MAG: hypothetical protein K6C10_10705, partial [Prevotella sp.]|nr:hypothetical protein [Prevotella sp.]